MAKSVSVRTQKVPRALLAQLATDPRVLRLLENLGEDVSDAIPGAMDALAELLDSVVEAPPPLSVVTLDVSQDGPPPVPAVFPDPADEGPPPTPVVLLSADEGPPPAVAADPDIPQDLTAQINALRDRLATLEREVAQLSERPTP